MRNLFTDGKNSIWHVLFGMMGYYWSFVSIIFVSYQIITEIPQLNPNMFIDLAEFLAGYLFIFTVCYLSALCIDTCIDLEE